jgi:hypothetical protein
MLIDGSSWFNVDHGHLGHFFKDVKKNYKDWSKKSKLLSRNCKKNFSYNAMKELLIETLDENVNVPTQIKLNLPKMEGIKLPTIQ